MAESNMTFDPRCYGLAEVVLSDISDATLPRSRMKHTRELAQAIQRAIEDYIHAEIEYHRRMNRSHR